MALGTILTGIVNGGVSLLTHFLEAEDLEQREAKTEKLAEQQRADVLGANRKWFEFQRERLQFEKAQDRAAGAERSEERAYRRKQDTYQNALALLAGNKALQDRGEKYWGGR